jgi:Flp pilus assembly protein TadD
MTLDLSFPDFSEDLAVELEPKDGRAHYMLGVCSFRTRLLNEARVRNPAFVEALSLQGQA